ncbi:inner-membrane translocator [Streptomyces brasiliensis]|uniref:N,N-dimethylformamidase alpha subunit domain-containing protein n=1 Tax=Streptomyces brasiliensis TaxID=1954 RepID=A0A917UNX0_9ACTN|nr:inner-membrane translocator [Streptomyces brasiliensis]GGJ71404.1 hypothetical protein GCM10010121_097520 [Streptomyces brasiliensis]
MPYTDPSQLRDHNQDWLDYYYKRRAKDILALVDDELIAEHQHNPEQSEGRHSKKLQEVLNHLRALPVIGKTFAYAVEPYKQYRIGIITQRGTECSWVNDSTFPDEKAAVHAIFLYRLSELRRKVGADSLGEVH